MQWTEEAIRDALDGHFWSLSYEGKPCVVDTLQLDYRPVQAPRKTWDDDALRELWNLKRKGCTIEEIEEAMGRHGRSISEQWGKRRQWARRVATVQRATIYDIRRVVCAIYHIGITEFCSRSRVRKVCDARQVYYWLSRNFTQRSTTQIGEAAGGRDHSTILHGVEKVTKHFDSYQAEIDLAMLDLGLEMPSERDVA